MRLSQEVQLLSSVVLQAGMIARRTLNTGVTAVVKEGAPGGSHHSIGTKADDESQRFILGRLRSVYPDARFLAEEECEDGNLIGNDNLEAVKQPGYVFIVDALDGTAGAYRRRFDWSVALNWMEGGAHRGGAIFAPDVRNGFHVIGEVGYGAFLQDGQERNFRLVTVTERPIRQSTVLYGVDVLKRKQFVKFGADVANTVETAVVAGSCALGVATVAAGRAEAIVQPHQWPWDWASVYIIKAAGGAVQFYHYRGGVIVPITEPDLAAYNRSNRTTEGGLGFIAGAPQLVDWLFKELQAKFVPEGTALPGV